MQLILKENCINLIESPAMIIFEMHVWYMIVKV